ncbi:hypothetical protein Chor_017259, partial [Crotalus horridus]
VNFTAVENGPISANICGLFPFTNYSVQVRAKYLHTSAIQSDGDPFWSDWSLEKVARTLPAVLQLIKNFKPLKPKEANGEILGYSLYSQRKGEPLVPKCITHHLQCRLLLPASEEFAFYLTAKNTVGISPATKLVIPPFPNLEGDHSLHLQWSLPSTPKMDFVLEWNKLPEKEGGDPHWQYQPENVNHATITEAIKPGNLYAVKIFGLVNGSLWAFGSSQAYSKQVAPLRAPVLYPTQVWKSWVELQWERLPLEERGGEIQNYTLYYKEEKMDDYRKEKTYASQQRVRFGIYKKRAVVLDGTVHRYVIKGLAPGSTVRMYMVTTNEGGSTRGSILSIRTKNYDYGEVEILLSVFCIGFIILLAGTLDFTSHCNEKWSQAYFGVTISDLLKVFPSQPAETDPQLLLGKQWLAESPNALQKVVPVMKSGTASRELADQQLQKTLATWNEVEYSRVLVVKSNPGPDETWSAAPCMWSSCWDLAKTCPEPPLGQQFWVQNLTYETLLDVKSYNRSTPESMGEFPLLVSLVTVDGELHSVEKSPP